MDFHSLRQTFMESDRDKNGFLSSYEFGIFGSILFGDDSHANLYESMCQCMGSDVRRGLSLDDIVALYGDNSYAARRNTRNGAGGGSGSKNSHYNNDYSGYSTNLTYSGGKIDFDAYFDNIVKMYDKLNESEKLRQEERENQRQKEREANELKKAKKAKKRKEKQKLKEKRKQEKEKKRVEKLKEKEREKPGLANENENENKNEKEKENSDEEKKVGNDIQNRENGVDARSDEAEQEIEIASVSDETLSQARKVVLPREASEQRQQQESQQTQQQQDEQREQEHQETANMDENNLMSMSLALPPSNHKNNFVFCLFVFCLCFVYC